MYAFVSNEYQGVVDTQRQLDFLCGIYTYPQFRKVESVYEAKQFFAKCNRDFIASGLNKYGRDSEVGYVRIEYFIADNNIYVNVDTTHFGFIKLNTVPNNVKQDSSYDLLKLKICNVVLDNSLIAHHCIAIQNILKLFDEYMNIEIVLPDISVFLACTKYKGDNYMIKRAQALLNERPGEIYYTVKR